MTKIILTALVAMMLPLAAQAEHHEGGMHKNMEHHAEMSKMHEGEHGSSQHTEGEMQNMSVISIEKAINTCITKCSNKASMNEESCYEKHDSHIQKMRARIKKIQSGAHQETEAREAEHVGHDE